MFDDITVSLAFIAGFLSFISPCVLPLVPAYVGYMGSRMTQAVSMQVASNDKIKTDSPGNLSGRASLFIHGIAFVFGFTVVFVTIGLMTTAFVSLVGGTIGTITDIIGRMGGVIIIFFGLHIMGIIPGIFRRLRNNPALLNNPLSSLFVLATFAIILLWSVKGLDFGLLGPGPASFSIDNAILALPLIAALVLWFVISGAFVTPERFWLHTIDNIENMLYSDTRASFKRGNHQGLAGSFLMGVVFSAGWTPCIGPLLGTILTVAANTGEVMTAIPLLTAYSLGLGVPFLAAALMIDSAQAIIRRLQQHMRLIERISGSLLILIGFLVASGQLTTLSQTLNNDFADFSYRVEECGLGFFRGEFDLSRAMACARGDLSRVAVNQATYGDLTTNRASHEYLFTVATDSTVDVELSRLTHSALKVEIRHGEEIIAQSTLIEDTEATSWVALAGVQLEENQHYRIIISLNDEAPATKYRLRIRYTQATAMMPAPPIERAPQSDTNAKADDSSATALLAQAGVETLDQADDPDGSSYEQPEEGVKLGNIAPDFTFTTLAGETSSLISLRGQPLILNFWGTWCGPCRREMPELQRLYETRPDEFTILALAVRDNLPAIREFQAEFGLTFPLALDEDEAISRLYAIPGQPSTLVLDSNGQIVFLSYSIVTQSQLETVLDELN